MHVTDAIDPTDDTIRPEYTPAEPFTQAGPPPAAIPAVAYSQNERVGRGLALALLVIPAGVIVWTVLWNIGFVASIVSWGVAAGAVWLYRVGSKARVTREAFWGIIVVVVVTVILSLLAGIFTDLVNAVGIPLGDALTRPTVWQLFADNIFGNPKIWQSYFPQVMLALLFAALGCFTTMRRLSRESRA